jgi:DUF4097 and DUF4098 domain-containing protein YvlB
MARNPAHTRRRNPIGILALSTAILLLAQPGPAAAQANVEEWCNARDAGRSQHCEIRQFRFTPTGSDLTIDTGANGSIEIEAWDGTEVRVTARITARARNAGAARDLAQRVELRAAGSEVRATGPRTSGTNSWTASVRVQVPQGMAVSSRTTNGAITVAGTRAPVQARTTNGRITVTDAADALDIRSTNGAITVSLVQTGRPLEAVQLRTTNGAVRLSLPAATSAQLELTTTNGGITTDIPVTVQGQVSRRRLSATMGNGGPEIRIATTNGAIRVTGN